MEFREKPINLIELGVYNGASLNVWLKYFERAKIIGVDIDPRCGRHSRGRVQVRIGSQDDAEFLRSVAADWPPTIVIDDGSHQAAHVIKSFKTLFPCLAPGGVYAIEDLTYQFSWDSSQVLRPHRPIPPRPPSEPVYDYLSRLIQARLAHVSAIEEDDPHLILLKDDDDAANRMYSEIDEIRIVGSMAFIKKRAPRDIARTLAAFDRRLDELAREGPERYAYGCFRYAHYLATYGQDLNRALALADEGAALTPGSVYGLRVKRAVLIGLGRSNEATELAEKLRNMGHEPDCPKICTPPHMNYPHL